MDERNNLMNLSGQGKFLLTGEYLVLKGAKALATPLKFGQTLNVEETKTNSVLWKSNQYGNNWFDVELTINSFEIIQTNNPEIASTLRNVFQKSRLLNPDFLTASKGIQCSIDANFDPNWGLGSSSTLIYLMSQWANINPYDLLSLTFGGSGYDIACAGSSSPLFYQLTESGSRIITPCKWNPVFKDHLYFVYLGKKMNSRSGMTYFNENANYSNNDIQTVTALSEEWIKCNQLSQLEKVILEHENLMSTVLKINSVKNTLFLDYPYQIKSLGAWGGDFILVTSPDYDFVKQYFSQKNLTTIFRYQEIILS